MIHDNFTQTGKLMTPSDRDNLCIYNVLPKATTKKAIQRVTQKHCNKPRLNYKKILHVVRKQKTKMKNKRQKKLQI